MDLFDYVIKKSLLKN